MHHPGSSLQIDVLRTASTVEVVVESLAPALRPGPAALVVDLCAVSFIDSTGIAVIVDAHQRASDAGMDFVVERPIGLARRAIDICGLDEHISFVDRDRVGAVTAAVVGARPDPSGDPYDVVAAGDDVPAA